LLHLLLDVLIGKLTVTLLAIIKEISIMLKSAQLLFYRVYKVVVLVFKDNIWIYTANNNATILKKYVMTVGRTIIHIVLKNMIALKH
jgi:hypothetical protein